MKLQKKGLLSDCEHLLTPLTTDQEGKLARWLCHDEW